MTGNDSADEELIELRYVGPATASTLAAESVTVDDVREKRVSYQMLVDAGINAGVATKIRRWHSLPWTFDGEEHHLDRRSKNVRHLQDDEREWVAASSDWREDDAASSGDDEPARTDDDWERDDAAARDETADRDDDEDDRPILTAGDWQPASADADGSGDASASASAAADDPLTEGDWSPSEVG
ncbi:helix-hairpin-helix domain-containing protein, partial [Natronoarchaeum mannanilyticum]